MRAASAEVLPFWSLLARFTSGHLSQNSSGKALDRTVRTLYVLRTSRKPIRTISHLEAEPAITVAIMHGPSYYTSFVHRHNIGDTTAITQGSRPISSPK